MNLDALIHGYRATCLLVSAVELGLIAQLSSGEADTDALAGALGADAASLVRLLRGLQVIGVVERRADRWSLSEAGKHLNVDLLRVVGAEYLPAWGNLAAGVREGRAAFDLQFGESVWQHRAARPELRAAFDRIMPGAAPWPAEIGFSPHGLIVDIGGGDGSLLASILVRHPAARGIVLDLPEVAESARFTITAAGLAERCRFVAGSFFAAVPSGGDLYLLRHILHDWDDAGAIAILRQCRAAIGESSRLVVIERHVPDVWDVPSILRDIHMMAVTGGRERTHSEYAALLSAAGFRVERHVDGVIGALPCG